MKTHFLILFIENLLLANLFVLGVETASISTNDYHESLALDKSPLGKQELFLEELDTINHRQQKTAELDEVNLYFNHM